MLELFLIRHGQSSNNAGPDQQRVPDPALTPLGEQQAAALTNWGQAIALDHLYCSPFLRSLQTTAPLAQTTQLTPQVIPDLCEQGGPYSGNDSTEKVGEKGMPRGEIAAQFPNWQLHETITEDGWWGKPYELHEEVVQRAERVSAWMRDELPPGKHAFVIHADFKRRLLEAMFPVLEGIGHQLGPLYNTGITRVCVERPHFVLHTLNATFHLTPDMLT